MTLRNHPCPFCDFGSMFQRGLLRHILKEHRAEKVKDNCLGFMLDGSVQCWCGVRFPNKIKQKNIRQTAWERHLDKEGGVVAHILKLVLVDASPLIDTFPPTKGIDWASAHWNNIRATTQPIIRDPGRIVIKTEL